MAHGSISDVLEEHVVGVIVCCACGHGGYALRRCLLCGNCSRCDWCVLLILLLSLLSEFGGGCVDAIYEQSNCGEILDSVNVCVDQHESVNAGKVVGVQSESLAHGTFENRATAVVFYGVLGGTAASKKAVVVACVSLLKSSCGVPFIPYCAEDSSPDPWWRGLPQLCK